MTPPEESIRGFSQSQEESESQIKVHLAQSEFLSNETGVCVQKKKKNMSELAQSMAKTTTQKESYRNDTFTNTDFIRAAGKTNQLHGSNPNSTGQCTSAANPDFDSMMNFSSMHLMHGLC